LKAGINWTTGNFGPLFLQNSNCCIYKRIEILCDYDVLAPRLIDEVGDTGGGILGETGKTTPSARMIPSSVVAYVIVSRHQGMVCQRGRMEGGGRMFFTRIGQQRNDGLHVADLWFRELEQSRT
jgi:hypothetical protein